VLQQMPWVAKVRGVAVNSNASTVADVVPTWVAGFSRSVVARGPLFLPLHCDGEGKTSLRKIDERTEFEYVS